MFPGLNWALIPPKGKPEGEWQVPYGKVESAAKSLECLLELGATKHEDVQDVGGGVKVATVKDPFGNLLGIIEETE
jgi:hypothetical protein